MKDQLRLLRDCINNDRPAVVFQGDDFCAPEILEAAKEIYRKHGCSEEFLFDWQLLINEVKAYQLESPATVKLPKLSPTETELVREEMTKRKKYSRLIRTFYSSGSVLNGMGLKCWRTCFFRKFLPIVEVTR